MPRLRLVAAVLAALVSWSAAARSDPLQLRYHAYGSGFLVLTFDIAVEEVGGDYRMTGAFRTHNLINWLLGFASETSVYGRLEALEPRPGQFRSDSVFRGRQRQIAMSFGADGSVAVAAEPPIHDEDRTPVPPASLPGAVDPLTAALRIALKAGSGAGCGGRVPVFDGRRRYDLVVERQGRESLVGSRYAVFAEEADICLIRMHRIGGFERTDAPRDTPSTAYLARIGSLGPAVPVRIQTDGRWGPVIIHLVEARRGTQSARSTP